MDKSTVHVVPRWILFFVFVAIYTLRVYFIDGWYIVTYGVGIYLLNNFIGFLSPQVLRTLVAPSDPPALPLPKMGSACLLDSAQPTVMHAHVLYLPRIHVPPPRPLHSLSLGTARLTRMQTAPVTRVPWTMKLT